MVWPVTHVFKDPLHSSQTHNFHDKDHQGLLYTDDWTWLEQWYFALVWSGSVLELFPLTSTQIEFYYVFNAFICIKTYFHVMVLRISVVRFFSLVYTTAAARQAAWRAEEHTSNGHDKELNWQTPQWGLKPLWKWQIGYLKTRPQQCHRQRKLSILNIIDAFEHKKYHKSWWTISLPKRHQDIMYLLCQCKSHCVII